MNPGPMPQRKAQRLTRRAHNDATYVERAQLHSEEQDGGCWMWIGCVSNGVPRVGRRSSDPKRGPINLRVALMEERGERPEDGYNVVATCGNVTCVNPEHLGWETRDAFFGRIRQSMPRKVSDERYQQAWTFQSSGMSVKDIAARLGVSRQTLYANWRRLGLQKTVTYTEATGTTDQ
jgi:hypothetical protein